MEKNKIFMIVIIVLLVVLLSAIGFLGFSLAKYMKNSGEEKQTTSSQQGSIVPLKVDEVEIIMLEKAISTNLKKGEDGSVDHIISVSIGVGANKTDKKLSPEIIKLLTEKSVIVRDICLSVISEKTYEELKRDDGREILRQEILARLQEEFQSNLIYQVYLSEWFVQ